eukprot:654341-Amorphochlora_amoeboformis.AAC.2
MSTEASKIALPPFSLRNMWITGPFLSVCRKSRYESTPCLSEFASSILAHALRTKSNGRVASSPLAGIGGVSRG